MLYVEETATSIAKLWNVAPSTIGRWKRTGVIPDKYIGQPLDNDGRATEQKLITLIEAGWLKARAVSRMIGHPNKINALLSTRRHPDDKRYHVNNLDSDEIERIRSYLGSILRRLSSILYLASITTGGQNYGETIQKDLRALLKKEEIDTANIRAALDKQQVARFWAFIYGRTAKREDLDIVLSSLKPLLELVR